MKNNFIVIGKTSINLENFTMKKEEFFEAYKKNEINLELAWNKIQEKLKENASVGTVSKKSDKIKREQPVKNDNIESGIQGDNNSI